MKQNYDNFLASIKFSNLIENFLNYVMHPHKIKFTKLHVI